MAIKITSKLQLQKVLPVIRQEQGLALRDVGRYIRSQAATYPPKADSTFYKRTGTLGRSITVSAVGQTANGRYVDVGTNKHYARYVEYGTGLYGPKHARIKPTHAQVLAWRSTAARLPGVAGGIIGARAHVGLSLLAAGLGKRKGKIVHNAKKDVYMVFARSIRGMRGWHFMEKAFKAPATAAYFQQRVQQMWARIQAAL